MLRLQMVARWNQRWRKVDTAKTTKAFFPTVTSRQRVKSIPCFKSTQMLTGHGCFNAYLASRLLQIEDRCICGAKQTALHLIRKCPVTQYLRHQFECQSGKSLRNLPDCAQSSHFMPFLNAIMDMELHLISLV